MGDPKQIPPKFPEKILKWFLRDDLAEEVLGDLEEKYFHTIKNQSYRKAKLNYWFQVINYLRPFAIKKTRLYNSIIYDMYKNYFKIGYRNLLRNKGYSAINIGGLAVGMAVAMLIGLWIHDELSFDKNHKNYDRIVQVMQRQTFNGETNAQYPIPYPLEAQMLSEYGSDFKYTAMAFWNSDYILSYGDKKLNKNGNSFGKDVIRIFDMEMLKGDEDALAMPNSIILKESVAQSFFGDEDPMNKMMKINNKLNVMVTGVYKDLPSNSTFSNLDFMTPWELLVADQEWIQEAKAESNWGNNSFQLFVELENHVNIEELSEKIKKIKFNQIDEDYKKYNPEIFLHPMKDWHLRSNWENGIQSGGAIQFVWLFGIIGAFVLILACINFMNLSTAHSEKRAKEVGIRKSIGSLRSQLINQFLTESFLVVLLAFVTSMLVVFFVIPYFNQLANKELTLPFSNGTFWLISFGFVVTTGLLAGSYPALYLSSFSAIKVLKGTYKAGLSASIFRKVLVVGQFTVSVALIIGTIMVEKQIQHTKNRPMGYDLDGTIMIKKNAPDFEGKFELIKSELLSRQAILSMAESASPLTQIWSFSSDIAWEGKPPEFQANFASVQVTHDFGRTISWEISEGRDFSKQFATDSMAIILNETAIKYMSLENPVGQIISWGEDEDLQKFRVIGVVKDLLVQSPFQQIRPTIYYTDSGDQEQLPCTEIRLNPTKSTAEAIRIVEEVYQEIVPAIPFDFQFVDQEHARKFAHEERIGKLSGVFASLAIFISCLGLFGLASFMAEQKKKEIGIRKVLGATVVHIWKMMSREFVILVVLSCMIAIPIAYYFLENWLNDYEYRTKMSWLTFAIACGGALIITIVTVSYQAIHAAIRNPVDSLRSE